MDMYGKHYHLFVSAWNSGKTPRALFARGVFKHKNQAYREARKWNEDPRTTGSWWTVISCEAYAEDCNPK